jgi:hypothetical protein
MIPLQNSLRWRLRQLVLSALMLPCAAAIAHDPPDAVIVTQSTAPWICTLLPAMARLKQPAVLVYSSQNASYIEDYLIQFGAQRVWLIDPSHEAPPHWREKYQTWSDAPGGMSLELVRRCWTEPTSLVLVDDRNTKWTLAASLLATARGEPAICLHGELDAAMRHWIRTLATPELVCMGPVSIEPADAPDAKFTHVNTLAEALNAYERALDSREAEHLVVIGCDPNRATETAETDWLIPQYAVHHRAAIAMLDRTSNIETQIRRLVTERYPALRYVTLWGNAQSLPDEEVDDPVAAAGLDTKLTEAKVAVAPLSGLIQHQPCQFRVGRITGDCLSSISLLIARNLHHAEKSSDNAPTALILANTDSDLPIMETITRTTAQTLERSGWQVRANYGWRTSWYKRFGRLWGADLVLYEGHTANLSQSVQFDPEREPILCGMYVFQGCKTLRQPEVSALLRNGAVGVVGTTTNTYSASGSALAKVLVDAMVLDQMDAGTSLMIARNFMLSLADLKQRRGHEQGPKIMRGGMTFSLWGDPTWRLPKSPARPTDTEVVRGTVNGNLIELQIPQTFAPAVKVGDYTAEIPLSAKLAGMYEWESEEHTGRQLPPLYFAVIPLPNWNSANEPRITSPLARNRWSSLWDPQSRWLYLLVQSSTRNEHDRGRKLSFHFEQPE